MTSGGIVDLADRVAALPRPLLLAFDVDGTLAPIVDDPDEARVPPETRRVLASLARRRGVRVALVTGRDARSLSNVIRLRGAYRSVEHGAVVIAPGRRAPRRRTSAAERARLRAFEAWAREHAVPHGARLEVKATSRAVHVRELERQSRSDARRLLAAARRAAHEAGLTPRDGRAVVEAELAPASKADALDAIRASTRARGVLYAGDDHTDVPALLHVEALGGVAIFVRSPERRRPRGVDAVDGPDGVCALLHELVERL